MRPHDVIRVGDHFWQIEGVFYGALGQEGVVHVEAVGQVAPSAYGKHATAMVPVRMLVAMLSNGTATLLRPHDSPLPK